LISLFIILTVFVISLLARGWGMELSARAVGSSRARLAVGVAYATLMFALDVVFCAALYIADALLLAKSPGLARAAALLVLVSVIATTWLCANFFLLRRAFGLTTGRTFAPAGAYIAVVVIELILTLVVLKPFVAEGFRIPTRSMSPTLEAGTHFVVNKIIRPRRWDLVAYRSSGDHPAIYCKRLIALPGEHLRFEQGMIYINGQAVAAPPVLAGRCHARTVVGRYKDGETITLSSDEYFFIGDNVDVSRDSRCDGPSSGASLVGVVDLTYWPLGKVRVFR
jgi:signal peptidase I